MGGRSDRYGAIATALPSTASGKRVGIKECLDIAGMPTRCGSPALACTPAATRNAAVVERLIAAGCRIVGTTVMHELAFGLSGINANCGTPLNPRWPDRIPGGSSSGSAVLVAAGDSDFALGTDTGGSIRLPACCCGVFGLKPSFGLVDRAGAIPAATSLDCIGVFTADLSTLVEAMSMLAPGFRLAPSSGPLRLKRVAKLAAPAIEEAIDGLLTGIAVRPAVLPMLDEAFEAGVSVINAEAWAAFGHLLEGGKLGSDVADRLRAARSTDSHALGRAEKVRTAFASAVDALLADADAILLPTLPDVPPTLVEARAGTPLVELTRLVRPFNLTGHPALHVPLLTASGLPAGLQLIGRRGEDGALCAAAQRLLDMVGNRETQA